MQVFNFNPGDQVKYLSKEYVVDSAIDLQKVLIVNPLDNTSIEVSISDLEPISNNKGSFRELSLITEQEWQIARSREQILKPLMKEAIFTTSMAQEVGKNLGLKERQVYNLVKKYRENHYELLSLVPKIRNKHWKGRIKSDLENIINQEIKKLYLNNQRIKSSKIVEHRFSQAV